MSLPTFVTTFPPRLLGSLQVSSASPSSRLFHHTRLLLLPPPPPPPPPTLTDWGRGYHEERVSFEHYDRPRSAGSLNKAVLDIGIGLVKGSAHKIPLIKLRIQQKENRIVAARFGTFGCFSDKPFTGQWVKGRTFEEDLENKNKKIAKYLSIPPIDLHSTRLTEDDIRSAVYEYKKKQEPGFQVTSQVKEENAE